ncbi:hypothetical protein Y032_0469g2022 [Ancylostoma ceylanicum]|uniref:Uncharacterized protein n=1 Tax=Ancylostoma ceylanicum TaxID=53326 RepID=A0A016WY40_9BILA|nr:hypothetical protein Y032_0469g2022 [Ancylostoma ceylanicum]
MRISARLYSEVDLSMTTERSVIPVAVVGEERGWQRMGGSPSQDSKNEAPKGCREELVEALTCTASSAMKRSWSSNMYVVLPNEITVPRRDAHH